MTRTNAHERVGEVVRSKVLGEFGRDVRATAERSVPRTNDGLGNQQRKVVGAGPAGTLNGKGNMCLAELVIADTDLSGSELGRLDRGVVLDRGKSAESWKVNERSKKGFRVKKKIESYPYRQAEQAARAQHHQMRRGPYEEQCSSAGCTFEDLPA